jgi:hypothetical protein
MQSFKASGVHQDNRFLFGTFNIRLWRAKTYERTQRFGGFNRISRGICDRFRTAGLALRVLEVVTCC